MSTRVGLSMERVQILTSHSIDMNRDEIEIGLFTED